MATFKSLLKDGTVKKSTKCNLRDTNNPDGCWALQNENLEKGHILSVSYDAAVEDLPKLIIDAFINKNGKIPDANDVIGILKKIMESMEIAVKQGKIPK